MATVEQRDTQPTGLAALSNTLDLFNDFKDDKDSDEESFHLPMLDCDDDLDSNTGKENVSNSIEKDVQLQNGETEDEILNKFETNVTPDIDPKIEDKLLDEIDDLCEKGTDEKNVVLSTAGKVTSQDLQSTSEGTEEKKSLEVGDESVTESEKTQSNKPEADDLHLPQAGPSLDGKEKDDNGGHCLNEDEKCVADEADSVNKQEVSETNENKDKVDDSATLESDETKDEVSVVFSKKQKENINHENEILKTDVVMNDDTKDESTAAVEESNKENNDINVACDIKDEISTPDVLEEELKDSVELSTVGEDQDDSVKKAIVEESQKNQIENEMEIGESEKNNESEVEPTKETNNCETTLEALDNENEEKKNKLHNEPQSMEVEIPESGEKEDNSELVENENAESTLKKNVEDNLIELPQCKDTEENKDSQEDTDMSSRQGDFKKPEDANIITAQSIQKEQSVRSNSEVVASENYENSNDCNKNLDCDDDLLDISIIRDADEDNASAIAENANDNHSSEKSDNDDQEEESEKAENELEESEMDQDESTFTNDKDDRMDFDDGNSSTLGYQENTVSGNTSDSEVKDEDTGDSENDSNSSSVLKEKTNRIADNELDSDKNQTDELRTQMSDADSKSIGGDDQDSLKENSVKLGSKRTLNDTDVADAATKKIKLSENASANANEKKKTKRVKTLLSFEKFMQNKKIEKKLTRSDLEQFCLQKICEAIVHKTDVGELHQTIKKQEQIIENLRKDLQQLTKQTRDLDIVNKKLMNELRAQNGIKKPLVPLKITRSVGLQVKLNLNVENNSARRKTPVAVNTRTPNTNSAPPRQRLIAPANSRVVRQIGTSPRKTPTSTPLLSQALQSNRQATTPTTPTSKPPPIRPKPTEPQKPANPGVIDLTDEDDKASKAATGTPIKIINKTIPLSQAKNLNIIPNKSVTSKAINANNQNKTVAIGQVKATTVAGKVATPTRTVTTLPQGVRLTPTQVKNGSITIPASVVTSSAGTTQLMYVVQPTSSLGQVVTSTAGGTQKAVLLNFQSTNGVLTSALNGSAVSVIPTKTTNTVQLKTVAPPRKHPAPLPLPPPVPVNASLKPLLPKPHLSIRKTDTGIILQWRMPYNLDVYEGIASYQLFAYQETNAAPSTDMWRKVGDVKALALPMACTLTQFADKNKYYFAVRSVDVHKRIGAFSDPEEISL